MSGDIPVVVTKNPVVVLKSPIDMPPTLVKEIGSSSLSHGFVLVGCRVESMQHNVVKTSCSGKMCDRQRVNEWNGIKGCGCFGISPNTTSLVVQHTIMITHGSKEIFMKDFSSIKYNALFMDGDFPFKCKQHMFQMSTVFVNLTESMENCFELINSNGGFTVVGWYRRGEISDQTMVEVNNLDESKNSYGKKQLVELVPVILLTTL